MAWICLVLFVRIGTFQWVTANPNKKIGLASQVVWNASQTSSLAGRADRAQFDSDHKKTYNTDFCFLQAIAQGRRSDPGLEGPRLKRDALVVQTKRSAPERQCRNWADSGHSPLGPETRGGAHERTFPDPASRDSLQLKYLCRTHHWTQRLSSGNTLSSHVGRGHGCRRVASRSRPRKVRGDISRPSRGSLPDVASRYRSAKIRAGKLK
jgi:hypothetical protein